MVDISSTINSALNSGALNKTFLWLGYSLLGLLVVLIMFFAWYMLSFNYKVTIFPVYGSGSDGVFSVMKPKTNRVKWIKHHTAWRKLWPLFNHKNIEPFDAEYIYPGKQLYAFEINNEWVPGRININKTEKEMRAEINPVPYFVRNWQGIEFKMNAEEYSKPGWWDENKHFVLAVVTVAICVGAALVTIYLTYKYLAPGRADIASLTNAIKSAGTIPSI